MERGVVSICRILPLLLLAACGGRGPSDAEISLREVCLAYDHAARVARVDTMTGELREDHVQADLACETVALPDPYKREAG